MLIKNKEKFLSKNNFSLFKIARDTDRTVGRPFCCNGTITEQKGMCKLFYLYITTIKWLFIVTSGMV